MQETFPIAESDIEELVSNAVTNVFDTMLDMKASLTGSMSVEKQSYHLSKVLPIEPSQALITGTVGFIGNLTGIIYIFMELPFAIDATCKLLDLDIEDVEADDSETVNDAIGELTNMICLLYTSDAADE